VVIRVVVVPDIQEDCKRDVSKMKERAGDCIEGVGGSGVARLTEENSHEELRGITFGVKERCPP
jgi:hypothetical protein